MKLKKGVNLSGLNLAMRLVLTSANAVWKEHNQELVVTSGLEGDHTASSLHYYGYAVDLRTRYFTDYEKKIVHAKLANRLQKDHNYRVILEKTHIHVEWRGAINDWTDKSDSHKPSR